jgi:hypothetical protein
MGRLSARYALLGLLCLLFSSCAYSKNPLSPPEESHIDQRLVGIWKPRDGVFHGSTDGFLFVGKCNDLSKPPGMMKLVTVGIDPKGGVQVETWEYFATSLGRHTYLNVSTMPWGSALTDDQRYMFFKYALAGDSLILRIMDLAGARSAVKDGKLHGALAKGGLEPVNLLGTTEELRTFLLAGGDNVLFPPGKEVVWDRVKQ